MKKTPEGRAKEAIRQYLRLNGWLVYPITQSTYSRHGMSDYVCIRNGRVIFLEVKAEKGYLTAAQKRFKAEIEAAAGTYVLAYGIDDVANL